MSRRMLSSFGFEGKQTLADDLESLVYVVLYCILLWLPHKLSKDDCSALDFAIRLAKP